MRTLWIVLVAVLSSLAVAACGDEGNVFSLEVGDCFQSVDTGLISDVEIVDCAEPHENEVFAVWTIEADTLPPQDEMEDGCIERFPDAIGTEWLESEIFAAAITPSGESFDEGDREVVCYGFELVDISEDAEVMEVTGSIIGSGR